MAGPAEPKTRTAGRRVGRLLLGAAPWLGLAAVSALWARDHHRRRPKVAEAIIAAAEPGRGRLASGPARIPAKGWGDILWRTWRQAGHDRLPAVAGGVTFYSLLAIFPAIGVFVSLYGLFADVSEVSRQLDQLAAFVPQSVLGLLGEQMVRIAGQRSTSLSAAFAVSLLLSVWSANAGVSALFAGLNIAYDETEKRNFVVRRAFTYAFTFAGLTFLTAVTGILVAIPLAVKRMGFYADNAWLIPFRWLVLLVLAMAAFAAIYRFGPSREQARWRWVRVGAVFAAVAWIGGSLAFSWYVNDVANFDATYGPLSAVVGFMVWIWFSVMVVLIGAELNAEIEHQTAVDSTTGAPLPLGERGATMADTVGARLSVSRGWAKLKIAARRRVGR